MDAQRLGGGGTHKTRQLDMYKVLLGKPGGGNPVFYLTS